MSKVEHVRAAHARRQHERWLRLQLQVRCALSPHQPTLPRTYLALGRHLVAMGCGPALATERRMLRTLLAAAADSALPRHWRLLCFDAAQRPLQRLQAATDPD